LKIKSTNSSSDEPGQLIQKSIHVAREGYSKVAWSQQGNSRCASQGRDSQGNYRAIRRIELQEFDNETRSSGKGI
jgi:hypothetical protein